MKKHRNKLFLLLPLLLVACASFSTNMWRSEQTAQNLVYTSYVAYTNGLATGLIKVTAPQSNAIKQARLKFAASIQVAEAWRLSYETNSTMKPYAQAALDAVLENSSNFVYVYNLLKQ
jgi:hypothetical protein